MATMDIKIGILSLNFKIMTSIWLTLLTMTIAPAIIGVKFRLFYIVKFEHEKTFIR